MAVITRDGVEGKGCSNPECRKWKPLSDFPTDPTHGPTQGGRHCRCKECHREAYKRRRASRLGHHPIAQVPREAVSPSRLRWSRDENVAAVSRRSGVTPLQTS